MAQSEKTKIRIAFGLAIFSPIVVALIMGFISLPRENSNVSKENKSEIKILQQNDKNQDAHILENTKQIDYIRHNLSTKEDLQQAKEDIKELIRSFHRGGGD